MSDGLIGYDPELVAQLERRVRAAVDDLGDLQLDDRAAAPALRVTTQTCRRLEMSWLRLLERIGQSSAMTDPFARIGVLGMIGAFSGGAGAAVTGSGGSGHDVPTIGADNLVIPPGATVVEFPIPTWPGYGVTRIQYFIDDHDVCLSGAGPDVVCGHGDGRGFATGAAIADYALPARVRIVLDHETGVGTVVASATHGEDGEVEALPIETTADGPVELPDGSPSQLRWWTEGDGIDGNIVFDYRFVNSETPSFVSDIAPAINGAVRVRRGPDGTVELDGRLAPYPSVEIIRDQQLPNGYRSTMIFVKPQESGGPVNLYEPGESFAAEG
ncbi:MAG: hypothetical protein ABW195_11180 [Ilumatobacteraceae bacterium]